MLSAEHAVDCDCPAAYQRPVLGDFVAINRGPMACMRCGAVSVTEALIDEPRPNDVRCLGHKLVPVSPAVLAWLSAWPRQVGARPRTQFLLPASLHCETLETLARREEEARASQSSMTWARRLLMTGYPKEPAPADLPDWLRCFSETRTALESTDDSPYDALVAAASTQGGRTIASAILAKRAEHAQEIAALLRDRDRDRQLVGHELLRRGKVLTPEILAILRQQIRAAPATEYGLAILLDTFYHLGPLARPLVPALLAKVRWRPWTDYYLRKRIRELTDRAAGG